MNLSESRKKIQSQIDENKASIDVYLAQNLSYERDQQVGRKTPFQAGELSADNQKGIERLKNRITELEKELRELDEPDFKGWIQIHQGFLDSEEQAIEDHRQRIIKFFDGGTPDWGLISLGKVPERKEVDILIEHINKAYDDGDKRIIALAGATGEGKSTVLRQAICKLLKRERKVAILWRDTDSFKHSPLDEAVEYVLKQNNENTTWILACDQAWDILDSLEDALDKVNRAKRRDILFLVCCNFIDLANWRQNQSYYRLSRVYEQLPLTGLGKEEAGKIVAAWKENDNLGSLAKMTFSEAVEKLLKAAYGSSKDNSFLGAMLTVRMGKKFPEFVRQLLNRLEQQSHQGSILYKTFIYVASVHAIGLEKEVLTYKILAYILEKSEEDVHNLIIDLGREASATPQGNNIVTRHRKIAIEAVRILNKERDSLANQRLILLNQRVIEGFVNGEFNKEEVKAWNFLSKEVFKREDDDSKELGIRLAEAVCEGEPKNPLFVANLGKLYREWNKEKADVESVRYDPIKLFEEKGLYISKNTEKGVHHSFYYEWAACEGVLGNHATDIYLSAVSLSDQVKYELLTEESAKMSLNGISKVFKILASKRSNQASSFILAAAAATQIGLKLNDGERTTMYTQDQLQITWNELAKNGMVETNFEIALKNLQAGIMEAAKYPQRSLPSWVPNIKELTFEALRRFLKSKKLI